MKSEIQDLIKDFFKEVFVTLLMCLLKNVWKKREEIWNVFEKGYMAIGNVVFSTWIYILRFASTLSPELILKSFVSYSLYVFRYGCWFLGFAAGTLSIIEKQNVLSGFIVFGFMLLVGEMLFQMFIVLEREESNKLSVKVK